MLYAFAALLIFQFLGELLVRALGLGLPGPLAGAMLLLVALGFYGRVPPALEQTSAALLQNLMLLFIPTVAAVMLHGEFLREQWLPFVVTAVVMTAVTLAVTAWVFKVAVQWRERRAAQQPLQLAQAPQSAQEPTSAQMGTLAARGVGADSVAPAADSTQPQPPHSEPRR